MFRWFRWQRAKKRLASMQGKQPPAHVSLDIEGHLKKPRDFTPTIQGYGRLANVWDDYAGWLVPNYAQFLAATGEYFAVPIDTVLDLACGTGLLTRQFAPRAKEVVGLDASEAMLGKAHSLTADLNVRYVQGDFRDFDLGQTFDTVVCGSDSLNYVATPDELGSVFACVQRHLRPGGLFAFDVFDHRVFVATAGLRTIMQVGNERFVFYPFYDPETRVNEARIVFRGAIEGHRRIAIEKSDVQRAADESGLLVLENFSQGGFLGRVPGRQFYLLRRYSDNS